MSATDARLVGLVGLRGLEGGSEVRLLRREADWGVLVWDDAESTSACTAAAPPASPPGRHFAGGGGSQNSELSGLPRRH